MVHPRKYEYDPDTDPYTKEQLDNTDECPYCLEVDSGCDPESFWCETYKRSLEPDYEYILGKYES